ncbi:MAG: MFS transporter [Zoogloeaceae bacterium]|jgi:MFS family permease|nr:MFS transporter [Zoogloeaceae bacterium]
MKSSLTLEERRAGTALAAIFGLRMLGLFLILPVFAPWAHGIPGGDNLTLVGLAIGAYGATQACLQIAWGTASDRWGRKPVIAAGLVLFALGSAVAALAPNIHWIIVGRIVQGAGAISAAVSALAADLTREENRTRIMAMIGASISLVFAGSLVAAPLLVGVIGMPGIFWLTGVLSLAAIGVLFFVVPNPPPPVRHASPVSLWSVLVEPQLARLNFGVFALHLTQTALWVLVPSMLAHAGLPLRHHWFVYLPAVLVALAVMVPAVIAAEKHGKMKPVFLGAIALLFAVLMGLRFGAWGMWSIGLWITLFFVAFNILEATQPSLISRLAPGQAKGKALGLYNTLQAAGLFTGGFLGGALAQHGGANAVFIACGVLAAIWLFFAASLKLPVRKTT